MHWDSDQHWQAGRTIGLALLVSLGVWMVAGGVVVTIWWLVTL